MSNNLVHLIYTSVSTTPQDESVINNLIDQARRNNDKSHITGILLYSNKRFFQILEGSESVIQDMYEKIRLDIRHTDQRLLILETIKTRSFNKTSMGYINIDNESKLIAKGLENFQIAANFLKSLNIEKSQNLERSFQDFNSTIH